MFIRHAGARRRAAFTLIEMLVVMTIIVLLATLAVLVVPRFSDRQKVSMGASQLQGWLFGAKQRAYRDRLVRGVRFLPVTSSPNAVAPGPQTVTPADISGIHPGLVLAIDAGNPNLAEPVTVLAVVPGPPATFMANFAKAHAANFTITPGTASDLQYTEQPDNFTAGYISQSQDLPNPPPGYPGYPNPPNATFTRLTITFPANTNIDLRTVASPGDTLYLRGGTEAHEILNVNPPPQPQTNPPTGTIDVTQLLNPIPTTTPPAQIDYWIVHAPRPLASEPLLTLPQDIVVDFFPNVSPQWQQNPPQSNPPYVYDVLFSPTGAVQQKGTAWGKYIYWVHDRSLDSPFQGEPTLISVFTNTGSIAAHPVNANEAGQAQPPVQSYYYFTQDARSSGM